MFRLYDDTYSLRIKVKHSICILMQEEVA